MCLKTICPIRNQISEQMFDKLMCNHALTMLAWSSAVTIGAETDLCLPFVLSVGFQRVFGYDQREIVIDPVAMTNYPFRCSSSTATRMQTV